MHLGGPVVGCISPVSAVTEPRSPNSHMLFYSAHTGLSPPYIMDAPAPSDPGTDLPTPADTDLPSSTQVEHPLPFIHVIGSILL
jgi:hypothetical protein